MQTIFKMLVIPSVLALSACGGEAVTSGQENGGIQPTNLGPWELLREESSLSFTTIKNGGVAEAHHFKSIDGKVGINGGAEFTIVLDSVDTNNEVRDPRMREFLFETAEHPYATVTADIRTSDYAALNMGEQTSILVDFNLDLHGLKTDHQVWVTLTRLGANKVVVANKAPVFIQASDHGLLQGVEKLRELANLQTISPVVPITFSLVFVR
jgi:polyisoprenoid-binding protein YceI